MSFSSFKRSFEHVDGNWASHCHLSIPLTQAIIRICICAQAHFLDKEPHLRDVFVKADELHISLSKTFVLQNHQIHTFLERLSQHLDTKPKILDTIFIDVLPEYKILSNDERTRNFICVPVYASVLDTICDVCDMTMASFGLSKYYDKEQRIYHISIGSYPVVPHAVSDERDEETRKQLMSVCNKKEKRNDMMTDKYNCHYDVTLHSTSTTTTTTMTYDDITRLNITNQSVSDYRSYLRSCSGSTIGNDDDDDDGGYDVEWDQGISIPLSQLVCTFGSGQLKYSLPLSCHPRHFREEKRNKKKDRKIEH
jgi:hypothetical protein